MARLLPWGDVMARAKPKSAAKYGAGTRHYEPSSGGVGRKIGMGLLLLLGIGLMVGIASLAKPMKELNCSGSSGLTSFGSCTAE